MEELPLRDIHLPDPISWWPLSYGYWVVGGLLLLCLIALVYLIRYLLRVTVKKQAKAVLHSIEQDYEENGDAKVCLEELSVLLRRMVISQKQKECAAGLTGEAWLKFLDQKLKEPEFSEGIGQVLITGPYQAKVDDKCVSEVLQLCRKWVEA